MMKKLLFSVLLLLMVAIGAVAQDDVTIGELSSTSSTYLPAYSLYEYSLTQQIYTSDEIGMAGTINSLSLWLKNTSSYARNLNVYMKEVDKSSFASSSDWESISSSDMVATATIANGVDNLQEVVFTLETPFQYSGVDNLLICIADVTGSWSSGLAGATASCSGNMAIYAYRDGSAYDTENPSASGSTTTDRNVVKLNITPGAAPSCSKVNNLVADNLTSSSADITWETGGTETNWVLKYGPTGFDVETAGTTENVSETPAFQITGLTGNTAYSVYVKAVCGEGDESGWKNVSFRTECGMQTIPYTETFEDVTGSYAIPDCWERIIEYTSSSATYPYVATNSYYTTYSHGGNKALYMYTSSTYSAYENIIALPLMNGVNTLQISLWAKASTLIPEAFEIGYIKSGVFTSVKSIILSNSYQQFVAYLNEAPADAERIAIRAYHSSSQIAVFVDDIEVSEMPTCIAPENLHVSNITTNSASVVWTDILPATAWQYQLNDSEIVDAEANPISLIELTANTEYTVKVRTGCGEGEYSDWATTTFTTLCEAISSLPYEQGFESAGVPSCWTKVGVGTAEGTSGASYAHAGSYYLKFSGTTGNNIIALPQIEGDLSSLVLDLYTKPESNTYANCGTFAVGYITDLADATTFVALDTYSYNDWSANQYEEKIVKMTSAPAGSYIALNHQSGANNYYWYVDDVTVREASHAAEILTYSLETQVADATFDSENGAIAVTVAFTTDLNALVPVYTISENAEISAPVVTVAGDGESCTIEYDVTAEEGTTIKHWTVTVTKAPVNHDAFITAFTFSGQKAETTAEIVSENDTYTVNAVAVWNADLTAIAPEVTISNAATVVPESGASQDFTTPVTYTVTAEDGTTIHAYTVTIVNDPDACINPTGLQADDVTAHTATLNWVQGYTETSYLVKVSSEAMTDMTATADVFDGTVEATTKALEGLNANTQYFVYVQSVCDNAEGWVSANFTTLCDVVAEFPFTEGFELTTRPGCWTEETTGTHYWTFGQSGSSSSYTGAHSGSYNASYRHSSRGDKNKLVSPVFDFGEMTVAVLEFWRRNPDWSGDIDYLKVYYRTAGDAEWTLLESYTDASSSWKKESITLVNLSSTYQIAFEATDNYGYGMGLDDVLVREASSDAEIVDFNFPTRMADPVIDNAAATVTATASYQADLENLGETVTVSDGAEYVAGATSIEGNVKTFTYTVTAEDGTTTKDWTVTVTKAESASTANDIVAFSFVGQVGESAIDPEAKTVTAYAEWDFDLENTDITPTITVSPMATINPASGVAQNFNEPVQYAVTAEDGESVANWNVTIVNDPNACINPDEITVENVTTTSATLSWDKMYQETSYIVKVSTVAYETEADLLAATEFVYDDIVALEGDEATLALTDLTPATYYYVYVQSNCENAESWTVTYFGTECDGSAYSVPFVETFDMSSNSVLCWTIIDANNDAEDYSGTWTIGNFSGNGGEAAYIYSSSNDAEDWLISPKIAIVDGAYLTFDYFAEIWYGTEEKFSVYVMDDPANYADATLILATQTVTEEEVASIENIDLSAYAGQEIYIGIKCESEADQDVLFIDNFKVMLPVYTITATAGENGAITPAEVTVNHGANAEFTITPAEGYRIESVVVDAETEGEVDVTENVVAGDGYYTYTFTNVTANHTIHATFELIPTYTITVEAGEHGTVLYNDALVSTSITVTEGETPEFVITPDTHYQILEVTVNGETIELTNEQMGGFTYTFAPVMANSTLSVTFALLDAADMIEAGSMSIYPNPNNGMFSIDFSNIEGDATYQIIDARGAVVETRDINVMSGETMNFNHDLRAGTYFVRIINGDKVYVEQIVVE